MENLLEQINSMSFDEAFKLLEEKGFIPMGTHYAGPYGVNTTSFLSSIEEDNGERPMFFYILDGFPKKWVSFKELRMMPKEEAFERMGVKNSNQN